MILFGLPPTSPSRTCRSRADRSSRRSRTAATRAARSRSLARRDSAVLMAVIRTSSSNGFSMKSTAPAFIASTARAISPWPVMTMTGRAAPCAFGRQPGPGVGDADLDHAVVQQCRRDGEFAAARRFGQDLDGVSDQVDQDLLDLDPVRQDLLGARIEPERHGDGVLARTEERQRA